MAYTLAEAAKLATDVMRAGVIETIVKESPVLQRLPFIAIVGNALLYNRENAMATAAFHAVGGTWAESTPTFTQVSAGLKILGGDADVDNYVRQTRQNIQDIEAATVDLKAKAVAHTFEDHFVYGNATTDTNAFDGLQVACATAQRLSVGSGSTGAALSLKKLDNLVDLVKPGRPDLLMMSRRTRRGLATYARSLSGAITYQDTAFGRRVIAYDDIPVVISDFIVDTETIASGVYSAKTGGATTSVIALKFGDGFVAGLENGGIQVENVGLLETKDATRRRVKWYVGLALFSTLALAILDGISSADVVI